MSNRELMNLAEQALFALGGVIRDLLIGTPTEEVIAKAQARMETFERVRHGGKTREQVQRKHDRTRRTYKPKLKLRKATS